MICSVKITDYAVNQCFALVKHRLFFVLICLFLVPMQNAFADDVFDEELESDRPDFTEGTQTIQSGRYQFELGYTFTKDDEDAVRVEEHVDPEILARIGLIEDLELRLAWSGYTSLEVNGSRDEGVTDLSVGFKHRMYRAEGFRPDLSFIAELNVPVGSSFTTSDELEFAGKLLWAYPLEPISVAGNINFGTPIGEDGRYLEISNSLALGVSLSERIGTYLEYFGFYPVEDVVETTLHFLNGGFTYSLNENVQFDIRAGFGLNDPAAGFFTGAGLVFRM